MKDSLLCTLPNSLPLSRLLRAIVVLKTSESKANTRRAKRSHRVPGLPASSRLPHDAQDQFCFPSCPSLCASRAPNRHRVGNAGPSRPTAFDLSALDSPMAHDETTTGTCQDKYSSSKTVRGPANDIG